MHKRSLSHYSTSKKDIICLLHVMQSWYKTWEWASEAVFPHQERVAVFWPGGMRVFWHLLWAPGPRVEAPPLAPLYTHRRTGTGCTASSESWLSCWMSPRWEGKTTPSTFYSCSPERSRKGRRLMREWNRKKEKESNVGGEVEEDWW